MNHIPFFPSKTLRIHLHISSFGYSNNKHPNRNLGVSFICLFDLSQRLEVNTGLRRRRGGKRCRRQCWGGSRRQRCSVNAQTIIKKNKIKEIGIYWIVIYDGKRECVMICKNDNCHCHDRDETRENTYMRDLGSMPTGSNSSCFRFWESQP